MTTTELLPVTIRSAYGDDQPALWRLAALDSAALPRGRLIVGEVDGEIRVAVSQDDLSAVADPFHLTADLVDLVRGHIRRSRRSAARRPWRAPAQPVWAR